MTNQDAPQPNTDDTIARLIVQTKILEAGVQDHEEGFKTLMAWLKTDLFPRLENLEHQMADMQAHALRRDVVVFPKKDVSDKLPGPKLR